MNRLNFTISFGQKKERIPILIIDCYVLLSLFLYFFGPIDFHSPFNFELVLYIVCFLLIINIAYFRAIWVTHNKCWYKTEGVLDNTTFELTPYGFGIYVLGLLIPLIMFVTSVIQTGFSGDIGSLANIMAQAYTFVQGGGTYQQGIDIPLWIYMHFAVFVYFTIVDGLIFFRDLSLSRKIMWGLTVVLLLAYFMIFKGTQKTLGDVFVLCASALLINVCRSNTNTKKRSKWNSIFLIGLLIAAIFAFATIMGERISYLNSVGYDAFKISTPHWDVNLDSILLSFVPKSTRLGFACLVFYLCNGFCGLSYCLVCPLTWTYGLASISDLSDILARRVGINVYNSTYMYEAYEEYGWHHSEQWHTLFPSLASDWTFLGALFIMGIVAYIYAICWVEILKNKSKVSVLLFSMMNIIWIYLPANNQIFSTRTTSLIFFICIIMWIRRNRNEHKKKIGIRLAR